MFFIIGIHGKMGSGKDYITKNFIVPCLNNLSLNYMQLSFADQLKINVMTKKDVPFCDLFIEKNKFTRELLQKEGTENSRNTVGEDIWINYHKNWCKLFKYRGINVIITSDVRFLNEFNYIKSQNGIVIKIKAANRNVQRLKTESKNETSVYNKLKNHVSECELDNLEDAKFDLIIDNDVDTDLDNSDHQYDIYDKINKLLIQKIKRYN